ncbi:hypothetical protein [Gulosibacter chungangensis]|uniref:SWIM zinc finger domain-containing protein n=1 Tax=Gulosibacter chungangensis TaxID=979746 RepID=A0A7J5B763_9MICO|nr:hypothetical protein [Gulosibacter chungangensis]KAB1640567.1 hypothetical protein F8O05_14470 [Gulosibacter chungangensis]
MTRGTNDSAPGTQLDVTEWLETRSHEELIALVHELASLSEIGSNILTTRASISETDVPEAQHSILKQAKAQLNFGDYVDYRTASHIADAANALLYEYESAMSEGPDAADAIRPALEFVLRRVRDFTEYVDDSNGELGDVLDFAVTLHVLSCDTGNPDPAQVAAWLVDYRATSPGWPETPLSLYEKVLSAEAFDLYRQGILKVMERPETSDYERQQWLLELADHDQDLDAAIAALSQYEYVYYREIVVRLRDAGRIQESLEWIDRAIANDRLTVRDPNAHWLGIDETADWLTADGQQDRAMELLRHWFSKSPTPAMFTSLTRNAEALSIADEEVAWAREEVERLAEQSSRGDIVIEIALLIQDLDWAWSAYDRWGSQTAWRKLAQASASTQPKAAADLFRPYLAQQLLHANTSYYPEIAHCLATMRTWYATANAVGEFEEYLAGIRAQYKNRPALMRELKAAGL